MPARGTGFAVASPASSPSALRVLARAKAERAERDARERERRRQKTGARSAGLPASRCESEKRLGAIAGGGVMSAQYGVLIRDDRREAGGIVPDAKPDR